MSDRKSKEEKRAEREERRSKRRRRDIERHTVECPHCQKGVLDHMTKCPHCGGELKPSGYRPPDAGKLRIAKTVGYALAITGAVIAVILVFLFKK